MLKVLASCFGWIMLAFCALPANSAILLSVPDKVARGDAFLARAESDRQTSDFTFYWRGKPYAVSAEKEGEKYIGQILLPVPLEEKSANLHISVSPGIKKLEEIGSTIQIYDKKRPVQKLVVDKKYVNPPAFEKARIEKDREKVKAALASGTGTRNWSLPFARPVQGSVSSQFGMKRVFNGQPRSVHRGLDLRGAQGTPIKACADGRVALVDNLYYSGNTVYLDHGNGVFTAYLHMSEPKVQPGQLVRKGDIVGLVGATGRVTGPHLHLSMIVQGQSVDPSPFLEERKKEN